MGWRGTARDPLCPKGARLRLADDRRSPVLIAAEPFHFDEVQHVINSTGRQFLCSCFPFRYSQTPQSGGDHRVRRAR